MPDFGMLVYMCVSVGLHLHIPLKPNLLGLAAALSMPHLQIRCHYLSLPMHREPVMGSRSVGAYCKGGT